MHRLNVRVTAYCYGMERLTTQKCLKELEHEQQLTRQVATEKILKQSLAFNSSLYKIIKKYIFNLLYISEILRSRATRIS